MQSPHHVLTAIVLLGISVLPGLADEMPINRPYPEFQIGVTGIWAHIPEKPAGAPKNPALVQRKLLVTKTTPGTPAAGKFQKDDLLLAVNGKSLEVRDPRPVLGKAINRAEGSDGKMTFAVRRGEEKMDVTITLKVIGSYSKTWPENCRKSERILRDAVALVLEKGLKRDINGYLEALLLLATGDDQYLPRLKDFAHEDIKHSVPTRGLDNWQNGYRGIFLAEYYLRTGDEKVLPRLEQLYEVAAAGQYYGGWTHGPGANPGYVTGGHVHASGLGVLISLFLARECGVDVDEGCYNKALTLFYRYAGHGTVPYGDHHPTMFWSDNGKNAMLATALSLLPGEKFQSAAQVLALSVTDSYNNSEGGHGSSFTNHLWRGITDQLVSDTFPENYRRHKDMKAWYYDLARLPGGGFKSPPWDRSLGGAPTHQTGLLAFAYVSHKNQLRINGKPRTPYSVKHKPTKVELELPFTDAQRPGFCPGGTDMGLAPHEIRNIFTITYDAEGNQNGHAPPWDPNPHTKKMPLSWYATMMRHYDPDVRSWAAHYVGYAGEPAIPEILKALRSEDDRLRVAGLEAISGIRFWGVSFAKLKITPEMIDEHFLPYILGPLQNPDAPMWEKRHALMALAVASKETVGKNVSVIEPYFYHDEWWLRVAASTAVRPLIEAGDALRPCLDGMLKSFAADRVLASRRWGIKHLLLEILKKNDSLRDELVPKMARAMDQITIRGRSCLEETDPKDFDKEVQAISMENLRRIDANICFEMLRYIDMDKHPKNTVHFLPLIEKVYSDLGHLPAGWIFSGARWGNIGYIKVAEKLGEEARPVIASMKRLLPNLKQRAGENEWIKEIHGSAIKAIKDYEDQYGEVKT